MLSTHSRIHTWTVIQIMPTNRDFLLMTEISALSTVALMMSRNTHHSQACLHVLKVKNKKRNCIHEIV